MCLQDVPAGTNTAYVPDNFQSLSVSHILLQLAASAGASDVGEELQSHSSHRGIVFPSHINRVPTPR